MKVLVASVLLALPVERLAALQCNVSLMSVDFAEIQTLNNAVARQPGLMAVSCEAPAIERPFDRRVTVCLGLGAGSGAAQGDGQQRLMVQQADAALAFQIYQSAAQQIVWGSLLAPPLGPAPPPIRLELALSGGRARASTQRSLYFASLPNQQQAEVGDYLAVFAGQDVQLAYDYSDVLPDCEAAGGRAEIGAAAFEVRARVAGQCSVAASSLDFGKVLDPRRAQLAASELQVRCAPDTAYRIGLGPGLFARDDGRRQMQGSDAAATIAYDLYQDSAFSRLWGQQGDGETRSAVGNGQFQRFTVYGRAQAAALLPAGDYQDQVVVTITF